MTNHYTPEQLASFPWIVSCDTLRPEDLLVTFWSAAETCAVLANRPLLIDADTLANLQRLVGEDSKETDWNDELAADTVQQLADTLNDASPCGFYFGASEGDGACFGFWIGEEWTEALEHCGIAADSDPDTVAPIIAQLDALGVTPDSIEDQFQGESEGYSEEQAGADYAQQLAEDCGDVGGEAIRWPFTCIDWEAAWRELETGDCYSLVRWSPARWLVFRTV